MMIDVIDTQQLVAICDESIKIEIGSSEKQTNRQLKREKKRVD
jgi:hypothetical protein